MVNGQVCELEKTLDKNLSVSLTQVIEGEQMAVSLLSVYARAIAKKDDGVRVIAIRDLIQKRREVIKVLEGLIKTSELKGGEENGEEEDSI